MMIINIIIIIIKYNHNIYDFLLQCFYIGKRVLFCGFTENLIA